MTGDFPPHELRGGLGNVMDPGGGGNTLKPSPLPNVIAGGGPGMSTASLNAPGGPAITGIDDPQAFALLVAKLAGEMFGGSSLAPTPSVSSGWTSAGASPPASPGFSPMLVAATSPDAPAATPSMSPSQGAMPSGSTAVPTLGGAVPSMSPSMGGSSPSSVGSSNSGASNNRPPTSTRDHQPSRGTDVPTSPRGTESVGKSGVSSAAVPTGSREGGATRTGGSTTGASRTGGSANQHDFAGNPLATQPRHANPFTATPVQSDAGNPFDAPKLPATSTTSGNRSATSAATSSATSSAPSSAPSSTGASNPFDMAPDFTSLDGGMPFVDLRLPMFDAPMSPTSAPGTSGAPVDVEMPMGLAAPANLGNVSAGDDIDQGLIRELGGVAFDPYRARADFPILDEEVHGKRLVWLDNAATTQKPLAVIRRLSEFYKHENSNIHRAAHTLAARATDAYEKARATTREFLNAPSTNEIIFVRGATEGINLVAQSWGRKNIGAGDEIVITHLEHHANIVPWQQLCSEKGARLRVAPVDDRGDVLLEEYEKLLGPKTKLVALPQVSNALGTITPARQMVEMAHRYGARVLVDGAQAVSHMRVDVQLLDCDFYVFSGHKVFAPTGIGVVFGKRELLEAMPPWQGGGNMIQDVTFERTTYQPPPFRFEAGTGNIADAAGLGTALEYVMRIGMDTIDRYEHDLLTYATGRLAEVPGLTMIGTSPNKAGVLSFVLDGQRTEDVGAALDQEGIAVRSGHHCAQPILRRFGVEATVRASLAFYNVCEDVDALIEALKRLQAGR